MRLSTSSVTAYAVPPSPQGEGFATATPWLPLEEQKAAPPVADAAAGCSNEAQSPDSSCWLDDNAEL